MGGAIMANTLNFFTTKKRKQEMVTMSQVTINIATRHIQQVKNDELYVLSILNGRIDLALPSFTK